MAKLFPSNVDYRSKVEEEADKLLTHHRTPKGLLFNKEISKWGSLRYAANWAFFLSGAARLEPRLERSGEYIELGKFYSPKNVVTLFLAVEQRNAGQMTIEKTHPRLPSVKPFLYYL